MLNLHRKVLITSGVGWGGDRISSRGWRIFGKLCSGEPSLIQRARRAQWFQPPDKITTLKLFLVVHLRYILYLSNLAFIS